VIGRKLLSLANPGNPESQPYLGELRARTAPTACPPVGLPLNGPISCQVQMASVWPCCHKWCRHPRGRRGPLEVRRRRLRSRRRLRLCPDRLPRPLATVQKAVAGGLCRPSKPRQRRLLPLGPGQSKMRTMAFMWRLFFLCATMAPTVRRTGKTLRRTIRFMTVATRSTSSVLECVLGSDFKRFFFPVGQGLFFLLIQSLRPTQSKPLSSVPGSSPRQQRQRSAP